MALPTTIAGVLLPDQNYYLGPFLSSGGNVYVVVLDSVDKSLIEVWKATDPTSSFSEQDSLDKPNLVQNVVSVAVYQVADVLHIAHMENTTGTSRLGYSTFNLATDQWAIINEQVFASLTNVNDLGASVSVAVRSDGDVIVLHMTDGGASGEGRLDYSRREAAVWTTKTQVDNRGVDSGGWFGGRVIRGSSDRMHLFFFSYGLVDAYQRCLRSDNNLESFPGTLDDDPEVILYGHHFMQGVAYEVGGVMKVRCPYFGDRFNAGEIDVAKCDSADTPTMSVDENVTDNLVKRNPSGDGAGPIACATVYGSDLYILYADATTADLWLAKNPNDAGWGVDTEVLDAVTINGVSCNVYTRGTSVVLAYLYDDGGTIKYHEVVLATVGTAKELSGLARGVGRGVGRGMR